MQQTPHPRSHPARRAGNRRKLFRRQLVHPHLVPACAQIPRKSVHFGTTPQFFGASSAVAPPTCHSRILRPGRFCGTARSDERPTSGPSPESYREGSASLFLATSHSPLATVPTSLLVSAFSPFPHSFLARAESIGSPTRERRWPGRSVHAVFTNLSQPHDGCYNPG